MKKCYPFVFFVLLFLEGLSVHGQEPEPAVGFKNGGFKTGSNISKNSFDKESLRTALYAGHYFVLVQFSELPSPEKRQQLKDAGLELNDYLPGKAYLATINSDFDFSSIHGYGVTSVNTIPAFYKIDPALLSYSSSMEKENAKSAAVGFNSSVSKDQAKEELQKLGALLQPSKFSTSNLVFIEPDRNIINAIAALPFVNYISLQSINDKALNYKGRALHGVTALLSPAGRNLGGRNVTVGVGDNAEIATHVDFTGRVINRVYSVPSFHGIHTSGTVVGGGILDPKNNGLAPRAMIVSQWFSDVITNTPSYIADYNMIATNNSYTAADNGCAGNGVYDVLSNYADVQMKNFETVLHVFSAGNDGTYTCPSYPPAYGTVKTGWQCSKNVITVGAMNQADYSIANFSSRGPVLDGRLKPEIVASGVSVLSTRQNNTYGNNSGTSMSGPMVAGAITILNERYRQLYGSTPKASLIKALLCNTAEDLGNPGPDYTFGFGMLNARRAAEAIEGNRFFISSATPASYNITVPAGARRLKVMLYWADPAAAPNAANTLVNDLDLTVTDPFSFVVLPLVLNPSNVTATAAPNPDHTNNIEQVVIDNPAAGNFSLNVSAFSVPQGPQEYILTYQVDMNGITVEYPFGGETLVPGETEVIRWTAYGDENNSFSVDTSNDNGATWATLNNNVPATSRSLNWTVPSTISNNALIRVSRNASVYTDQSDFPFVKLGQPVVTATVPCEGFVQLDWPAVTGATSYDILQLKGDTMSVIGTTTGLTYLVDGLAATTTYWFGVAAKNNGVSGRRSVSKTVIPSTGTCTLTGFDNNFKAVSIDAPISGRQFTSGALTAAETVKLTIKNLDNAASSGTYNLYYQVNAAPAVMETNGTILASLGTYQYAFTQTADLSAPGIYVIKAWVKRAGDTKPLDDTAVVIVKNLANPVVTLPVSDGFETTDVRDYISNTIGLDGDDRLDFKTNSTRGRARSFVNTGFALNGNRAITLDQFPYNAALNSDSLLMTYNLSNYNSTNQLRLDLFYKNHGQDNNPGNRVWIRGRDTDPWVLAYDLIANQGALGQWKHCIINVNDVLGSAVPVQIPGLSFQVKIGQQGNTSANIPNPVLDQDDGYTIDDVSIREALNDVGIKSVISPVITGCGISGPQPVSIQVKNYSATTFTNVPVSYSINGGAPVSELIPVIGPNSTQVYTFTSGSTLAINTDYNFNFWLTAPTDNYSNNDSILNYTFHTSPVVNTFPYLEGFESNSGNWYSGGLNNSWQWGTPAKTVINKAANGTKAWVTSTSGNYNNNELSYLYSPCFDLSGLTQPVLSFSHIFQVEDATPADYTWIEYSTDGGVTWTRLGTNGVGTNWYNDATGKNQWRTSLSTWHVASTDIPTTSANVRFRFVMSSDLGFNVEGVGIDDIHIFDKTLVYTGAQLLNTTQTVSGSNWIHFTSGGNRIASLNPNGQNLGNTTVDVYPYAGAVRNHNYQYYLNRNIVVRPATPPVSPVSVRFYFTDAEAKSLIAATGCSNCSKPVDPYDLGVTKYSGPAIKENGTLSDNLPGGSYQFILPANTAIIPFNNGYYAEFSVSSFSEFWLNNGGLAGINPLPLSLLVFEAVKQNKKVLLQWSTDNEVNTAKFTVERSNNGRDYLVLTDVAAVNRSGINNYNVTDAQPLAGTNFYRLKLVNSDGTFLYSPVRRVSFEDGTDLVTVYPNPVRGSKIFVTSSANCTRAILYDAAGKMIKNYLLQGRNNTLDLSGVIKGIYQLKVFTENAVQTQKIVVQ